MFGPAPAGDPLSPEEVAELPNGAPVTVIWFGGNGPHPYIISVDRYGVRRVRLSEKKVPRDEEWVEHLQPRDRVWLRAD